MSTVRFTRRTFSFVLAVIIVFSVFVFVPGVTQTEASATEGYVPWSGMSEYLRGKGTSGSPFLISSPQDLKYFRKMLATSDGKITYYENNDTTGTALTKNASGAHYKLTCDIFYNDTKGWEKWSTTVTPDNGNGAYNNWIPPGETDESNRGFEGTFNGNGYTIYGLYSYHADYTCVGFFGTVKYGDIENLTLAEGFIGGGALTGAFVGRAKVGVDVINCVNKLNVQGTTGVGGIIGGNAKGTTVGNSVNVEEEGDIPTFTVFNCVNYGKISGTKWVGGTVGYITAGAARAKIEKCVNYGAVNGEGVGVGGILGGTYNVDGYDHNVVESCVNYAEIVGGSSGSTGYVGGVVGCARATDIYNCVNTGSVKNIGTSNYTGGITGGNRTNDNSGNTRIENCFNSGDVYGTTYVGGIAAGGSCVNIHRCGNVGNVTGTEHVGGISGKHGSSADSRNSKIYDCYNAGTVVSTTNAKTVAGIVGNAHFEGTLSSNVYANVKRCINLGAVSSGRNISYSESTVKNSEGTGIYIYTKYADTCFAVSGINSNFDGGTAVQSLCSETVLSALNSVEPNTWRMGYPMPTLNSIDYDLQNYMGRSDVLSFDSVKVASASSLSICMGLNKRSKYYGVLNEMGASYGVLAVKKELLGEATLTAETAGAVKCPASSKYGYLYATLSGQTAEEYGDVFVFRPYASFVYGGATVYVYGDENESSYYTAKGASDVVAVRDSAAFKCDEKLYVLVGGTGNIGYSLSSVGSGMTVSFTSDNPAVASVSGNKVTGVSAGTATITAALSAPWGTKTLQCTVTVLEDFTEDVLANQYANQDGVLRIRTNEIGSSGTAAAKNDAYALDFNGTVILVDSGNNNDKALNYLLRLREEYLAEGLASGALTEAEYYRHLLSDKCRVEIIALVTHWHSDHINGLRYDIAKNRKVSVKKLYTVEEPTGTGAENYSSYISAYNGMMTALATYNPSLTATRLPYESKRIRYFSAYNKLSTTDTTYPLKVSMCPSYDWSTYSGMSGNSTAWQNCSSMWFLFEYAGKKLLFTGDTFPNSGSITHTANLTSGTTAVDRMLSKYKALIDTSIDFLECNHHGRAAYVKNLFTETKPSIVFAGIISGYESVKLLSTAVTTADVYLGGDQEHVFTVTPDGVLSADGAAPAYSKNKSGHALRNYFVLETTGRYTAKEHKEVKAQNLVELNDKGYYKNNGAYLYRVHPNTSVSDFVNEFSGDVIVKNNGAVLASNNAVGTGCVVYSADGTKSITVSVFGDADSDGLVTSSDCLATKSYIKKNATLGGAQTLAVDINEDGIINSVDYVMQKMMLKS